MPSPVLRSAGFALALLFRLLPRRFRFPAALVVARLFEPLIRRTAAYETRLQLRTDGLRETSLELLLSTLTRRGTTFDPAVTVDGAELLPRPESEAVLILGPHTMLSLLFVRYLADQGHDAAIISADPFCVAGTRTPARVISPSPALFVQVRRHLLDRKIVAGMIDRGEPERRTSAFRTAAGPLLVSDALLRLALRQNVRVVFIATNVDAHSRVVVRLARSTGRSVDELLAEFACFTDEVQRGALSRAA